MRHGISGATHPPPPSADTLHREGGRVVIHPHTHPTHVPSQVVYPIRSHFAFARFTNFEIVNAHWFRLPLDLPLPPAIFSPELPRSRIVVNPASSISVLGGF